MQFHSKLVETSQASQQQPDGVLAAGSGHGGWMARGRSATHPCTQRCPWLYPDTPPACTAPAVCKPHPMPSHRPTTVHCESHTWTNSRTQNEGSPLNGLVSLAHTTCAVMQLCRAWLCAGGPAQRGVAPERLTHWRTLLRALAYIRQCFSLVHRRLHGTRYQAQALIQTLVQPCYKQSACKWVVVQAAARNVLYMDIATSMQPTYALAIVSHKLPPSSTALMVVCTCSTTTHAATCSTTHGCRPSAAHSQCTTCMSCISPTLPWLIPLRLGIKRSSRVG
jgi:hypothetical protein